MGMMKMSWQGLLIAHSLFVAKVIMKHQLQKRKMKAINENIDTLLQVSKPSSSSDEYSQVSINSILETLTKEHSSNLEKMNNVVNASTSVCNETTKKSIN